MINYAVEGGHQKTLEDVNSLVPTTCFVAIVSNVEDEEFNLIMDTIMTLPAYPYAIFLIQGDRIQLNITRVVGELRLLYDFSNMHLGF